MVATHPSQRPILSGDLTIATLRLLPPYLNQERRFTRLGVPATAMIGEL